MTSIVEIKFENRGNHVYAFSPDLPGLNVCGATLERVEASIPEAIVAFFACSRGERVSVAPVNEATPERVVGTPGFMRFAATRRGLSHERG